MNNSKVKKKYYRITLFLVPLLLVALIAAASFLRLRDDQRREQAQMKDAKQYVCSMHPQVIRDVPGDCPICGMFLIEKIERDQNSADTTLNDIVSSVNSSVLGSVMTVIPEQKAMPVFVESTGVINYDPRKIKTVSARFGGIIERSMVKYQFQHITEGQKIYEIYCPDIYAEKYNYVKLVQAYPDRDDLTREAQEWFRMQGLSKGQIDSLKRSKKPDYHLAVYCYAEGFAVSRDFDPERFFFAGYAAEGGNKGSLAGSGNVGLNDGVKVEKGDPLFKLIDVRSLRADLKVKTDEASLLKQGQKVIITDPARPDKLFVSTISQIDPLSGGLFQSVKVYITDNERYLVPGRQIQARIVIDSHEGLWIPVSAVINLGQSYSVFVLNGNRFVATGVSPGVRSGDKIEIHSGIDSESEIAEKALLLTDSDGFIVPD